MYYARPWFLRIYEKRALRPFMASVPSWILRNILNSATHRTNISAPPEGDCGTTHYAFIHSVKSHRFFPIQCDKGRNYHANKQINIQ